MRVAAGLLVVAAAASIAAAESRPRSEFRARLVRISESVAHGCDLFDGGSGQPAPAVESSAGAQTSPAPPPAAAKPLYKEVAAPATVPQPAQPTPIDRFLEGTRNLAHKARVKIQELLDGTRNL